MNQNRSTTLKRKRHLPALIAATTVFGISGGILSASDSSASSAFMSNATGWAAGHSVVMQNRASATATTVAWDMQSQRAKDVDVGAGGQVWVIGTTPAYGGYTIHHRTGATWETIPGGAVHIAVASDGQPWVVNAFGEIFRRTGNSWKLMPGSAHDIAAAADGLVYVVGTDPVPGGYGIHWWNETFWKWERGTGGAVRIGSSAAPGSGPWLVNDGGRIFKSVPGEGWVAVSGTGTDVTGGRHPWMVSRSSAYGGYTIHHFDGVGWDLVPGGAIAVAAEPTGNPWVVNNRGELFRGRVWWGSKSCPFGPNISVPESASSVAVATLQAGESVQLVPNGHSTITPGWLMARTGPAGYPERAEAGPGYPLVGARKYSLLVDAGQGWRYLGSSPMTVTNLTGAARTLRFRVNDNWPNNGDGAFALDARFTCRT